MKLTEKEEKLLLDIINQGFFDGAMMDETCPFVGYMENYTPEQKGLIGSLVRKGVLIVHDEYEEDIPYIGFVSINDTKTKNSHVLTNIWIKDLTKKQFIDEYNLILKNNWWVKKSND